MLNLEDSEACKSTLIFFGVYATLKVLQDTRQILLCKINLLVIKAYAKNTRILHQTFHLFPYHQIENLTVLVKFANNNCSSLYFYTVSKMLSNQQGKR